MPKVSPIQSNFNQGEYSPLMYGRVDFDGYRNALKTCFNGIPLVQGAWTRRPGTYFCDEVADSSKATRVIPFEFSTLQAYIIEASPAKFRFKRNNAPVRLAAQDITGISKASPAVVTYSGSDTYANGDQVDISGVVGMVEVNGRRFTVAGVNTGANTFQLAGVDSSAYTTYVSGGTIEEVYEIATPYAEADLFQLRYTQSADVLYITHPGYAPRKLSRTAHTAWTLSTISFLDGPYLAVNSTATTLALSTTTGSVTVTASVSGVFASTDVGRLVRWKDPAGKWTWLEITAFTDTDEVTATIKGPDASAGTATANWRLGLYSATTGYPACVTFFEDRLFFGGSTAAPQRIDGSKTGDYENMAPTLADGTVTDEYAIAATLNSNDVQVIRWMTDDEKGLLVGTTRAEWIVRAATTGEALSPTNISAKPSTKYGSANVNVLRAGKAALYVQRAGRKLRELAYVYEVDGFRSPDMTVLAEHVTKASTAVTSGIKELAYQQEPQSLVWAPLNDGVLLGFTYEREQKVLGWHRHALGGYSDAGHTAASQVESVACIPSADGTRDELWVVVKRYINGGVKRYNEYLTKLWEKGDDQEDAFYVDCGLTYDGAATTTGGGAYHIAGETVQCLVDGATHPDITINATGGWTITRAGSKVQIGYAFNSDGQLLRPEAGAADGTAQGKLQRAHRISFRLHDTLGIKFGPDFNHLDMPSFRTSAGLTATQVALFSGDVEVPWSGDYTTDNTPCWRVTQPLPATILAAMPQMHTQDR